MVYSYNDGSSTSTPIMFEDRPVRLSIFLQTRIQDQGDDSDGKQAKRKRLNGHHSSPVRPKRPLRTGEEHGCAHAFQQGTVIDHETGAVMTRCKFSLYA